MYDTKTRVVKRLKFFSANSCKIEDCDLYYSIMETPFKRDVTRELVEAGRKRGLRIGLYFSHIDWYDMDFRFDEFNPNKDPSFSPESEPKAYERFKRRHRDHL